MPTRCTWLPSARRTSCVAKAHCEPTRQRQGRGPTDRPRTRASHEGHVGHLLERQRKAFRCPLRALVDERHQATTQHRRRIHLAPPRTRVAHIRALHRRLANRRQARRGECALDDARHHCTRTRREMPQQARIINGDPAAQVEYDGTSRHRLRERRIDGGISQSLHVHVHASVAKHAHRRAFRPLHSGKRIAIADPTRKRDPALAIAGITHAHQRVAFLSTRHLRLQRAQSRPLVRCRHRPTVLGNPRHHGEAVECHELRARPQRIGCRQRVANDVGDEVSAVGALHAKGQGRATHERVVRRTLHRALRIVQ